MPASFSATAAFLTPSGIFEASAAQEDELDFRLVFDICRCVGATAEEGIV